MQIIFNSIIGTQEFLFSCKEITFVAFIWIMKLTIGRQYDWFPPIENWVVDFFSLHLYASTHSVNNVSDLIIFIRILVCVDQEGISKHCSCWHEMMDQMDTIKSILFLYFIHRTDLMRPDSFYRGTQIPFDIMSVIRLCSKFSHSNREVKPRQWQNKVETRPLDFHGFITIFVVAYLRSYVPCQKAFVSLIFNHVVHV